MTLEEMLHTSDPEAQTQIVRELLAHQQNFTIAINVIGGKVSIQPLGFSVPIAMCRDALIKGLAYLQEVENVHRQNDLQQSAG